MTRSVFLSFGFIVGLISICHCAETVCVNGSCRRVQPARLRGVEQSIARIEHCAGGSEKNYGSGTLIQTDRRRSLILTCAHLFEKTAGSTAVQFIGGSVHSAKLVAIDRQADLALLEIAPITRPTIKIAADYPMAGNRLTGYGFGTDGRLAAIDGQVTGYLQRVDNAAHETVEMTGAARQGDSGGPILNSRGQLAAVIWGSTGRTVDGTYCGRIRRFLSRLKELPGQALNPISQPDSRESTGRPAQLAELIRKLTSLSDRVESIGQKIGPIREKLDRLEQMGEKVGTIKSSSAISIGLLSQLGLAGLGAVGIWLAIRLVFRFAKRRRREKKCSARLVNSSNIDISGPKSVKKSGDFRANDSYAKELAELFSLSGRSQLGDATLGRGYDEALREAEASSDPVLANWAGRLRRKVADQYRRIHDDNPLPAEPK